MIIASCADPSDAFDPLNGADTLRFSAIAAGARHTCALDLEGAAHCWGHGFEGQTGLAETAIPFQPRRLTTSLRFASIVAGSQSTCAIERNFGGVYCWGILGSGSVPRLIEGSEGAESVALTVAHACARFPDGTVGCFGETESGQLGPGATPGPDRVPGIVMVPGLIAMGTPAVGYRHSCAVGQDGTVSCWGLHEGGQLGIGDASDECPIGPAGELRPCSAQPTPVGTGTYTAVAAGLYHTCALRADGEVECWGDDDSGQLGVEAGAGNSCDWLISPGELLARVCSRSPLVVDGALELSRLEAGYFHTCGIEGDGDAQCWGTDTFGQTGGEGRPGRPGLVASNLVWTSIAAGQLHTCGVTESGATYCWGDGEFGQLGSLSEFSAEPILVTGS